MVVGNKMLKKTKIVCTIGPSSDKPEILKQMILAGMNVARLNFSHGAYENHLEKLNLIRNISDELKMPVAILQDLSGPKIRIGVVPGDGFFLQNGSKIILTPGDFPCTPEVLTVSHPRLCEDVMPGDIVLLADGILSLKILSVDGNNVSCEVIHGGILTSHKGVNFPNRSLHVPAVTDKDLQDLKFGIQQDVDYIALSFVRRAEEIIAVRNRIQEAGKSIPIIAKIEKHEAIDNMNEILDAADGIMVARGDLGVELPFNQVPMLQKMLINEANKRGKPVITATQMLRSMVDSSRPTRAEAADVVNAVLDGTDAVMLSEESAMGSFPVESIQTMAALIIAAENNYPYDSYLSKLPKSDEGDATAHATCILAEDIKATAIIPTTQSGKTAMRISRFRPRCPIISLSPSIDVVRRLCLFWGCMPHTMDPIENTDDMIEKSAKRALETELVQKGSTVIITAGHPSFMAGSTNLIKIKKL